MRRRGRCLTLALSCVAGASLRAQPAAAAAPAEPKPKGSTTPLSPDAEAATFKLPPGFSVRLVAAEPLLEEPVMCVFDGDGRVFVAEMRTYMQDIDGTGEDEPKSRVSMLWDDDGDGRMDRRTTFADGLVLPRLLLPLADGVLIGETYTTDVWLYRDADGDGVADGRELWRRGKADKRNLEHQDSALTYGIDNWFYTAMGGERLRHVGGELRVEKVSSEFAQWGLAVDDVGRQFFASAGGERPAFGFQRHPRYGRCELDGELADEFGAVFGAIATPDVQGGTARLRDDGTLNHFTGCCGQCIYRGDALPAGCRGDYFVCEPVGRLVRRAEVRDEDGKIVLRNRHVGGEFWTSTDMNFRPVWSTTGPDGALWVVDMYRGIIQEGNWVKADSYLRPKVEELGLQANVGRGRIWRVVAADAPARAADPPRLQHAAGGVLVAALAHDNGWWRETAQKLLVLRGERAVAADLRSMLGSHARPLARMHALWTLEGLACLTAADLTRGLHDADPRVRSAAIRASEAALAAGDQQLLADLGGLTADPNVQVAMQLALTLRYSPLPAARATLLELARRFADHDVVARAVADSLAFDAEASSGAAAAGVTAESLQLVRDGEAHYGQLCIACHGLEGRGVRVGALALAPPLYGSPRVRGSDEALLRIVLHGLVGPVDGATYAAGIMLPQAAQDDRYVAAVTSYVRTMFGAPAGVVQPADVAAVRAACAGRTQPWTLDELAPFMLLPPATAAAWKASASDGCDSAGEALDGDPATRFTTGRAMAPGMWWQVDLDAVYELTRFDLDTRGSKDDYPRGYVLEGSLDGAGWTELARGEGSGPITTMRLPKSTARHLRVTQTGSSDDFYWSIHGVAGCGRRLD